MCAPAILAGIRTSHIFLTENGCTHVCTDIKAVSPLTSKLSGAFDLRDTTDCFALRAPAILAGIRTPHIFLTENGCVLMSVRVSRTYPLLQQVEEWVIL